MADYQGQRGIGEERPASQNSEQGPEERREVTDYQLSAGQVGLQKENQKTRVIVLSNSKKIK